MFATAFKDYNQQSIRHNTDGLTPLESCAFASFGPIELCTLGAACLSVLRFWHSRSQLHITKSSLGISLAIFDSQYSPCRQLQALMCDSVQRSWIAGAMIRGYPLSCRFCQPGPEAGQCYQMDLLWLFSHLCLSIIFLESRPFSLRPLPLSHIRCHFIKGI